MAARASKTDSTGTVSSPKAPVRRARAARMPKSIDDAVTMIAEGEPAEPVGLPERRYSFNALAAIGIAGFLLGRLCSR